MKTPVLAVVMVVVGGFSAQAEPAWIYHGAVGTTAIDKGEEKAETHTLQELEVVTPAGNGEVAFGVGIFQPLGHLREFAEQETEFWLGYGRDTHLGEIALTAAYVEIEGGRDGSEFEVTGEYVAPLTFSPALEVNYNVTTEEILTQIMLGPEFEARGWAVGLRAVGGYLSLQDEQDRLYWGSEISAMCDLKNGVKIGTLVQWVDSNQDGFIGRVRSGEIGSFKSSGASLELVISSTY